MVTTDLHQAGSKELQVVLTDGRLIAIMVLWAVAAIVVVVGSAFAILN